MNNNKCELWGNFGINLQIILLIITLIIIFLKRIYENPKRMLKIYFLDNIKILTGYLIIHLLNILFSINYGNSSNTDQCIWYFSSYLIDCTLGLYINYFLLNFFGNMNNKLKSGNYFIKLNDHFQIDYKIWFYQLLFWYLIIIIMKIIVILIQIYFSMIIEISCNFIFKIFFIKNNFKLIFCVVIFPNFANLFQYIIQDIIIKKKKFKTEEKYLLKEYFKFSN